MWWTWTADQTFDSFTVDSAAEFELDMEMDWRAGATRDFSVVVWSSGSEAAAVTSRAQGVASE